MSNYKNSTFVLFFLSTFIFCQDNNYGLTVDWIHTDEAKAISVVHRYVWLDNNTAILYDPSKPLKDRDFKVLDPKKPNVLTPLFNVKKAVESLNEILDDTLDGLDWPISFDSKGEKALYNFKGDIFLLDIKTIKVPGVFEIPVTISKNIKKYDAFIALGCVIKGQTPHFDFISQASTNAIMGISVNNKKPIGNGIITCLNMKQAKARKRKGAEAAKAVISILEQ